MDSIRTSLVQGVAHITHRLHSFLHAPITHEQNCPFNNSEESAISMFHSNTFAHTQHGSNSTFKNMCFGFAYSRTLVRQGSSHARALPHSLQTPL